MLQNNVEMDLKMRMLEDSTTQTELAERLRVSVSYVNRITKDREQLVNKTFIAMMQYAILKREWENGNHS